MRIVTINVSSAIILSKSSEYVSTIRIYFSVQKELPKKIDHPVIPTAGMYYLPYSNDMFPRYDILYFSPPFDVIYFASVSILRNFLMVCILL